MPVIDTSVLLPFILASLVIILSPGADTFLLLRFAIRGGPSAGFAAMAGILVGLSLVSLLLISGMVAEYASCTPRDHRVCVANQGLWSRIKEACNHLT